MVLPTQLTNNQLTIGFQLLTHLGRFRRATKSYLETEKNVDLFLKGRAIRMSTGGNSLLKTAAYATLVVRRSLEIAEKNEEVLTRGRDLIHEIRGTFHSPVVASPIQRIQEVSKKTISFLNVSLSWIWTASGALDFYSIRSEEDLNDVLDEGLVHAEEIIKMLHDNPSAWAKEMEGYVNQVREKIPQLKFLIPGVEHLIEEISHKPHTSPDPTQVNPPASGSKNHLLDEEGFFIPEPIPFS